MSIIEHIYILTSTTAAAKNSGRLGKQQPPGHGFRAHRTNHGGQSQRFPGGEFLEAAIVDVDVPNDANVQGDTSQVFYDYNAERSTSGQLDEVEQQKKSRTDKVEQRDLKQRSSRASSSRCRARNSSSSPAASGAGPSVPWHWKL